MHYFAEFPALLRVYVCLSLCVFGSVKTLQILAVHALCITIC